MIEAGPDEGPDDNYRGRLMSLAIVYDWLYPWLDEGQKTRLRDSIIAHIERNWYFAERPNFIGGHSRWGNFALAAGLLAVITERPDLQPRLRRVRENWLQGYHPAQGWIAVDGGYHMGWAYGASYTKVRNHAVWSSADRRMRVLPLARTAPVLLDLRRPGRWNLPRRWGQLQQHLHRRLGLPRSRGRCAQEPARRLVRAESVRA